MSLKGEDIPEMSGSVYRSGEGGRGGQSLSASIGRKRGEENLHATTPREEGGEKLLRIRSGVEILTWSEPGRNTRKEGNYPLGERKKRKTPMHSNASQKERSPPPTTTCLAHSAGEENRPRSLRGGKRPSFRAEKAERPWQERTHTPMVLGRSAKKRRPAQKKIVISDGRGKDSLHVQKIRAAADHDAQGEKGRE